MGGDRVKELKRKDTEGGVELLSEGKKLKRDAIDTGVLANE